MRNSVIKKLANEEVTHKRNVPRVVPGIKPSGKPRRYHERNGAAYGRSLMHVQVMKMILNESLSLFRGYCIEFIAFQTSLNNGF